MTLYLVTWRIDIEADDPREAAATALLIQRDPDSIATVFEVKPHGGKKLTVDLGEVLS